MIRRLFLILLLSIIAVGGSVFVRPTQSASTASCAQDREAWLTHVLEKMESIKPGMTRWDVLKVFRREAGIPRARTESGPPVALRETFVSQDCPYFKIDVEFEPLARPDHGFGGWGLSAEDNRDVIVNVSKPYVQFATTN